MPIIVKKKMNSKGCNKAKHLDLQVIRCDTFEYKPEEKANRKIYKKTNSDLCRLCGKFFQAGII